MTFPSPFSSPADPSVTSACHSYLLISSPVDVHSSFMSFQNLLSKHDINAFLTHELTRVGSLDEGLQKHDWFTKDDVHTLVRLSDGLFIFAATGVRFIEDGNACN